MCQEAPRRRIHSRNVQLSVSLRMSIPSAIRRHSMLNVISGVGQSGGRSTWTSKAELQDHISFVGFFIHYLSEIYYQTACVGSPHNASGWTPITGGYVVNGPSIHLVIAGYCYGALMTRHLPDIPTILDRFSKVLTTSTQVEIRGRANRLASITVGYLRNPEYLRLIQNFTSSSRRMLEEEAMEYRREIPQQPDLCSPRWIRQDHGRVETSRLGERDISDR